MLTIALAGVVAPILIIILLAIFVLVILGACVTIVPQANAFIVERLGFF